jgi:hypothetical protein
MVNIEDVDNGCSRRLVDDAVGAAPGTMAAARGPNSGLPTRCGLTGERGTQNSSTAAARPEPLRHRRAAGWNGLVPFGGLRSRAGDAAPGQILANRGHVSAGFATA